MKINRQLLGRGLLAVGALGLAGLLAASHSASERVNTTVLLLVGAAVLFVLVPWDKLTSLRAAGVEITLSLPHVREAVNSLDQIGGKRVDNEQVLRALERLGDAIEAVNGSRVLWIEDNPSNILGVRRLLRALGADIHLVTSSRRAIDLLEDDTDFDLVISDLMRNKPTECITFEWMCATVGASASCPPEVIERDDGKDVDFEVRSTPDGTRIYQRREGVNFVVRLRTDPEGNPVAAALPVLYFASFPFLEASAYASPAQLPGFETYVTISAELLIPTAVEMLRASRENPISVGGMKKLVKQ